MMDISATLLTPQFLQSVGMVVVVLAFVYGKDLIGGYIHTRNGQDRRKEPPAMNATGIDFNRLLDLTEQHTKATMAFANETRNLTETIAELTKDMNRRSTKAMEQHDVILEEISLLDVPRK